MNEYSSQYATGNPCGPISSPKKKIQTAKYAEYAKKWNTSAYFAYSAVLSPFYFGDVFESSAFCAVLSGAAAVRRGFGDHLGAAGPTSGLPSGLAGPSAGRFGLGNKICAPSG